MFREELRQLTERVPGGCGALIMGLDGISVDRYSVPDSVNLEALAAEYLSMLKNCSETNADLGIGAVREFSLMTDQVVAIIMAVTSEYFLVFALPPNGNFGRARYEVFKSTMRLAKELA